MLDEERLKQLDNLFYAKGPLAMSEEERREYLTLLRQAAATVGRKQSKAKKPKAETSSVSADEFLRQLEKLQGQTVEEKDERSPDS